MPATLSTHAKFLQRAVDTAQAVYVWDATGVLCYETSIARVPYGTDYVICHPNGTLTPVPAATTSVPEQPTRPDQRQQYRTA